MRLKVVILICLLLAGSAGWADEIVPANQGTADLLVLPFVNYTHTDEAGEVMMAEVLRQLNNKSFTIITPAELRPVLKANRIRNTGMIIAKDAKILKQQTGISWALVGSFDFYSQENMFEVGLHLRIVDLENMHVRFAESAYDVGLVTDQLFQNGSIEELPVVLERVVSRVLENLTTAVLDDIKTHPVIGTAVPVGVVELDNLTPYQHAGRIISNQMLVTYLQLGFTVLEPGVIYEAMLDVGERYRGEINFSVAQSLHRQYNMLLLSTGSVEDFKPGISSENLPEIELSLRMIDGPSQKIVGMYQESAKGIDDEKLFQIGGCKSLGTLTQNLLRKMITTFRKDRHYDEYTKIMQH